MRKLRIVSSGSYIPKKIVTASEVDQILGLPDGRSEQMSGVQARRYVTGETTSQMAAYAIMGALEKSGLKFEDCDALIFAGATTEQPLPCTAAIVQRALGKMDSKVACFDIDSTCLSFVTAMDLAASLVDSGRYKRMIIVSSEIASVGLNKNQHEAYALFGDGAAAVIVEKTPENSTSHAFIAHMETFSEGAYTCQVAGGGTKLHARQHTRETEDQYLFHMDGRKVFRLVLEVVQGFTERMFKNTAHKLSDFNWVIPHQASGSGMELVRRKLEIPKEKYIDILANHGNMISASIPLALHQSIESGRIKRGDKVLLMGTSAGLSVGAVGIEY
ncbi:MAG: beta-ketoacyl-ACP synthase III [Xanthomonadaceae bacterium]|nr:beta-ketoacyl-ACP synthase III [Xanthomonadaceae bacterium]